MIFDDLLTFEDVKKEPFIIEHILWDIQPKDLLSPRVRMTEDGVKYREPIKGFVFYIEMGGKKPVLFLMRHTAGEYAETAAQIDEIPQEMLLEAVEENRARECSGMCPINKKVEGWLKKELGVKGEVV